MRGIIERFEGNYAIIRLGGEQLLNIPKNDLPDGVKEGDIIRTSNGNYVIVKGIEKSKQQIT